MQAQTSTMKEALQAIERNIARLARVILKAQTEEAKKSALAEQREEISRHRKISRMIKEAE